MTIETKFDINDDAWFEYDGKWYLCSILDIHFLSYEREISGIVVKKLFYRVYFKEITGIPPHIQNGRLAYIDEDELYKNKGGD